MFSLDLARRALSLLDFTSLEASDTEASVAALCERALEPVPRHASSVVLGEVVRPAAVCVFARFVPAAKAKLAGSTIRLATVANFPEGGSDVVRVEDEVASACAAGADEVDVVLPYRSLIAGDHSVVRGVLSAARRAARSKTLKVILESGLLEPSVLAEACRLSIDEGADFLKTSTGKASVGATPEAVTTLLRAALSAGRPVGVKVSGGVRSLAQARDYLELAEREAGAAWISPRTFRFGASSLFEALVAELAGRRAPTTTSSY